MKIRWRRARGARTRSGSSPSSSNPKGNGIGASPATGHGAISAASPIYATALAWAFGEGGEPVLGIRLTVAALPLWWEASLLSEAQARAEAALKLAQTIPCDDLLRTKLACARAWSMLYARKLVPETEQAWRDAIAFAERAGSLGYRLRALVGFSLYLIFTGRVAQAIGPLEEIGALSERHRDWSAAPEGERLLALARAYMGQLTRKPARARPACGGVRTARRALARRRAAGRSLYRDPQLSVLCRLAHRPSGLRGRDGA